MILAAITPHDPRIPTGCLMFYASDVVSRPMRPHSRLEPGPERRLVDYLNWVRTPWLPSSPMIASQPSFGRPFRTRHSQSSCTVRRSRLHEASFDLGLSATAFHWLNEDLALTKVAKLLRPGGWWAMVWNVFGDERRPDPFHEATKALLNGPFEPFGG